MDTFFKILFLLFWMISVDVNSQENNLQNFTTSDGLSSISINDIIQDKIGYLWLATDKGLVQFDGVNFKNHTIHSQSEATILFSKNNQLLVAHTSGLFLRRNDSTLYLGKEKVNKIVSLNDKILLGTNEGIYQFIDHNITPLKIQSKIDFSIINDVIQFENAIYIASNNGLWKLDKLIDPSKVQKIIDTNIESLLVINNQLAIQLKNKIQFYKNNKIVSNIDVLEDITSINTIDKELWITTNGDGIHIYNLPNFTFQRKINKYNSAISSEINTVFKDTQNSIWIASSNKGLYKYTSIEETVNTAVYIENISINYKKIGSLNVNNLELKPDENNISFTFKSVDLKNAKNIQYRYQLKKGFTPWTHQNNVDFANLKAGKYTFIVQSKNGKTLSKKVAFHFFIETPIYKKMWFLILSGVLLCLLLAGFIDLYIRKLNKKNQQKVNALKTANHLLTLEQKALQLQMNPHFIFNVLNGIKALGNSGKPKELNKIISQFSILLRSVLNNSRLEKISLKDEIETLKNYLELEQKMNSKYFEFSIETLLNNIDSEEILIPPMLLQPFVENCIKHAFQPNTKDPRIKILFEVKNNFLHFVIEDNGIGYHQSKKEKVKTNHHSVALAVTKERIQHISKHNSFSIEEIKNEKEISGTIISFKIPLKTDY
ncbi:sensor histidine kinase [Polaribacter sp. SA4-12]|uniref:sensor histidine kinase n=1 Tax=Polaribacter sp. SA4-12 TaxID=1312072 RepID=UPI000B3D4062|nr:sensor histidine kinase [Polaribacter sp. SA4-12]ARV14588.1 hypothetical protein BTO07_05220 [Polaribacter sp. SA4-12]